MVRKYAGLRDGRCRLCVCRPGIRDPISEDIKRGSDWVI
jgi:hypothetical protein